MAGSDSGASAVEYAIVVSLIAVVIIVAVTFFGDNVAGLFERAGTCADAPDSC
jgi:Flp pilus assembly pilin Flp